MKNKYIVLETLANVFYLPVHLILQLLNRFHRRTFKYYCSVCAIFKNEGRFLKEWLEYQKIIGIDHIYLYNNDSEDNYYEILKPYVDSGYVTLIDFPGKYKQKEAYEHCFANYGDETRWLAIIDIDEFICPYEKRSINEWLKPYEAYPAISLYWRMFGTNGRMKHDDNLTCIEQYTHAWKKLDGIGKVILNTACYFAKRGVSVHHKYTRLCGPLFSKIIIPMITENRWFVFFPQLYRCPKKNTIQINHYWSKALDVYVQKMSKGDVFAEANEHVRKQSVFFYNHETHNICEEKTIWRFLMALKLRMTSGDDNVPL